MILLHERQVVEVLMQVAHEPVQGEHFQFELSDLSLKNPFPQSLVQAWFNKNYSIPPKVWLQLVQVTADPEHEEHGIWQGEHDPELTQNPFPH